MRRSIITAVVLLCFFLASQAIGQDASLSGTVADASGGVIPNATVTATNANTGVVSTTVTNAAGVYSFPRLIFGVYTVKAEQKGFQPKTFTKVTLGAGQQARLNFQMEVSGVETKVEVSSSAEQLLLESSSSVGDVLSAQTVMELPLVNRNALDLIKVMSGVVLADDVVFNANASNFAGVGAAGVNIQRDGMTVNDVRFPTGINAATRVNPDMVGEFRMILAPVDAEMGRGNAQIQIATKAGTNEYHGGLVWNVQNTALDPRSWNDNRLNIAPVWRNLHQYTGNVGGPIIKNKTFFFALFDGQLNKRREQYNVASLTSCAQRGVLRFYDNWNSGNILQLTTGGSNPARASVNAAGAPVAPTVNPDGTPHNRILRYASVFGTISNLSTLAPDCSNVQVTGGWDPLRSARDPSGYLDEFLKRVPPINNYEIGDGLNTGGHRWSRTLFGADNQFGVGEDTYRRQINVRIDHNFNDAHRVSGSWSWEKSWADNNFATWPDRTAEGKGRGYGGKMERRPMVLTVNFISSIRPTLLNEFKFGMSRTGSNSSNAYFNPDTSEEMKQILSQWKLPNGEIPVLSLGMGRFGFSNDGLTLNSSFYGGRNNQSAATFDTSPRWTWGDTVSWMKGTHSFRFGGEIRRASSEAFSAWTGSFFQGHTNFPFATGGEIPSTPQTVTGSGSTARFLNSAGLPLYDGILAGSNVNNGDKRALRDLLVFQSGSIASIRQWRFINTPTATAFNSPLTEPFLVRDVVQKEFSLFFKDDWKIRPDLTLNLGVRYDYYGVPYLKNGMTVGLQGGGEAILGPSLSPTGGSTWFAPIARGNVAPGSLVKLLSLGPESANPDQPLYNKSWRNVGPAVGFAYQLPWFGKGKTTIRGGYQISYIGMTGNFSGIAGNAGTAPGTTFLNTFNNNATPPTNTYFGIKDLTTAMFANGVPVQPSTVAPGIATFTLYDRLQSLSVYSQDYKYPYIQNLTFAITRNVTSNLTVDLRYIGTLTRKNFSSLPINTANFITNGLLQAFDAARRGEDPVLLDQLLFGLRLPGSPSSTCLVDGTTCKGGAALRASNFGTGTISPTALNLQLAMGQYEALASQINVLSTNAPGYASRGQFLETNGFPVNFIKASPQFNTATLSTNQGHANYHSFQGEVTLRPTHGISFTSRYTWSKNLGITGSSFSDPRNLFDDYDVLASNRPHSWTTYGTLDLPFGPGRSFGKSTSGAVAKAIGNWQISWISSVQSGAPLSITAQNGLYANGTPDVVGNFDYDSVGAFWPDGAAEGNMFGGRYVLTGSLGVPLSAPSKDPQCLDPARVAPSLQSLCTLQAVLDKQDNYKVVLQNPVPGTKGNMGINELRELSRWTVDMSLSKAVMLTETKSIRLRMDFTNIFNHVMPSGTLGGTGTRIVFPTAPITSINAGGTNFGAFPYKVGGRTFQMLARFDF